MMQSNFFSKLSQYFFILLPVLYCNVCAANPVTIQIINRLPFTWTFESFQPSEWTIDGKLTPMEELRGYSPTIERSGSISIYQKPFDKRGFLGAGATYRTHFRGVDLRFEVGGLFSGDGAVEEISCYVLPTAGFKCSVEGNTVIISM